MKRSCSAGRHLNICRQSKYNCERGLTIHRRIVDDHYEHALRLYRDKDSGGIRLQASVLRGDLKRWILKPRPSSFILTSFSWRTPVWTAFITHQVQSRKWMKQVSSKVVHLADLQRYIFTTEYYPQLSPGGKHELSFIDSGGNIPFLFIAWLGTDLNRCKGVHVGYQWSLRRWLSLCDLRFLETHDTTMGAGKMSGCSGEVTAELWKVQWLLWYPAHCVIILSPFNELSI